MECGSLNLTVVKTWFCCQFASNAWHCPICLVQNESISNRVWKFRQKKQSCKWKMIPFEDSIDSYFFSNGKAGNFVASLPWNGPTRSLFVHPSQAHLSFARYLGMNFWDCKGMELHGHAHFNFWRCCKDWMFALVFEVSVHIQPKKT